MDPISRAKELTLIELYFARFQWVATRSTQSHKVSLRWSSGGTVSCLLGATSCCRRRLLQGRDLCMKRWRSVNLTPYALDIRAT